MQDVRGRSQTTSAAPTLNIFGAPLSVLSDGTVLPMVIGDQIVPPGYQVPNHVHADDDELFYIIEGELTITGPHGDRHATAGACIALPRGTAHGIRNAGEAAARMLVILLPGTQGLDMLRHFDDIASAGPPNLEEIGAIAARYGVRFV